MLLQMSDGVYGTLSDAEILACMQGAENPAESIIAATIGKKKPRQDNCSVIVTYVQSPYFQGEKITRHKRKRR
ncbi:MAG: hypothetical protein Q4C54_08625 [Clostridia bacterium]|nr:hypothetical protein [Clostridia bacterium]